MRNKSKQLNFRVSEEEYERIIRRAKKAKLTLSKFILYSVMNKPIVVNENLKETYLALNRIGTNLNQITRLCNEGKVTCPDVGYIKRDISKLWEHLSQKE